MNSLQSYIQTLRGPILVLGASGFIGANLYHRLAAERTDVFAVVQEDKSWRLEGATIRRSITVDMSLDGTSTIKSLIDTNSS